MNHPDRPLRFVRGVYGVTPEWDDTDRLLRAIEQAARGGMTALQWRNKTATGPQRQAQARALAAGCKALGLVFIVNDSVELALQVDADGVHVGRDDPHPAQARALLGPDRLLGCSCYNQPGLAQQALQNGADYIAFGALYPSSIKPDAVRATTEHLRAARALAQAWPGERRPAVVAIGGINALNAAPVVQAGADSIALISGLFEAPDIEAAAAACAALFQP